MVGDSGRYDRLSMNVNYRELDGRTYHNYYGADYNFPNDEFEEFRQGVM